MAIRISKVPGGYVAETTPPDSVRPLKTAFPRGPVALARRLQRAGVHLTDYWDEMLKVDPTLGDTLKPDA